MRLEKIGLHSAVRYDRSSVSFGCCFSFKNKLWFRWWGSGCKRKSNAKWYIVMLIELIELISANFRVISLNHGKYVKKKISVALKLIRENLWISKFQEMLWIFYDKNTYNVSLRCRCSEGTACFEIPEIYQNRKPFHVNWRYCVSRREHYELYHKPITLIS